MTSRALGRLWLPVAALLCGLAGPAQGQHDPLPEPIAVVPEGPAAAAPPIAGLLKAATATYEDQVVAIVNQERLNNGSLPPLKKVDLLDNSSELHSVNMEQRNFFMHCDPDTGKSPFQRMIDAGYNYSSAGENIAAGYSTPAAVMTGWMGSSGHRANILNTGFREIGVGYHFNGSDAGGVRQGSTCAVASTTPSNFLAYWTQNFGRRNGVFPVVINREAFETTSQTVNLYVYNPGSATQMRFSNDGVSWSSWVSFSNNMTWTLTSGNGMKTVHSQVQSGATVFGASDTILLSGQVDTNAIFSDGFETGSSSSWVRP